MDGSVGADPSLNNTIQGYERVPLTAVMGCGMKFTEKK
jgi:hypothetical protein